MNTETPIHSLILASTATKERHRARAELAEIEAALQDDTLFNFISRQPTDRFPERIELLFYLAQLGRGAEEPLPAGQYIRPLKAKKEFGRRWKRLTAAFRAVLEWQKSPELGPLVNYLVVTPEYGDLTIPRLLAEFCRYDATTQSYVYGPRKLLKGVRDIVRRTVTCYADTEHYFVVPLRQLDQERDRDIILKTLTLANVLYEKAHERRYDFVRHIDVMNRGGWALVYIRPRSVKTLAHAEERREWAKQHLLWLRAHRDRLMQVIRPAEQAERLDALTARLEWYIATQESTEEDFGRIVFDFVIVLRKAHARGIGRVGNVALLPLTDLEALSDIYYCQKKERIDQLRQDGRFIPPLTRKVFRKTFPGARREFAFWSEWEADLYTRYIEQLLSDAGFLSEE